MVDPLFVPLIPGSVLFATAAQTVGQDNANLFFDDTNNQLQLGPGTSALPSLTAKLFSSTGMYWQAGPQVGLVVGAVSAIEITPTETVINESGAARDFRVESDVSANVLTVGGSAFGGKGAINFGFTVGTYGFVQMDMPSLTAPATTFGRMYITNNNNLTVTAGTPLIATLILDEPALVGAAPTIGATLAITGAPTEGTSNFGLLVQSGVSAFGGGVQLASGSSLAWSSGAVGAASDLFLKRVAAGFLGLENGANSQSFLIYNSLAGADSSFLRVECAAGNAFIRTSKTGAGTSLPLHIRPDDAVTFFLGTNGVDAWQFASTNHFLASTDNTNDIGAVGANRPRTIFAGTAVRSPLYIAGATNGFTGTVTPVTTITVIGGIVTNVA